MTDLLSGADWVQVAVLTAASALCLAPTIRILNSCVHALQQDDYSNRRFEAWLKASGSLALIDRTFVIFIAAALAQALLSTSFNRWLSSLVPLIASIASLVLIVRAKRPPHKKPLVYTGRVKRLLAVSLLLMVVTFVVELAIAIPIFSPGHVLALSDGFAPGIGVLWAAAISMILAPRLSMLANFILWPLQASINLMYRVRARRKLSRFKPMVVGITGSYGKTSTKYFTEALMESRFRVLKTRASFNTILGVCRAINEELGPEHEVLIVEMGAYRRGEIRDMARLTRPHIGVLTAIGPQHLERFGSIETIEKAKFELPAALAADGIAVMNNDDPRVRRLAATLTKPRVLRYGVDTTAGELDLAADEIAHGPDGLAFTLVERDGRRTPVKTRLIGIHNVSNILAAATVARAAGVTMREIAGAIGRLQPVPHRLEVHTGTDGVTIIDDAYNSNPVGAFNALEALKEFRTGRKILITPGMVELGAEQDARNQELGVRAAGVCDFVILVGPNQTAAIRRGLDGAGYAAAKITTAKNLNDGLEAMKGIVRAGDVVLFENDLPDLYEE
jgi:UDP-N-acetylmuramoyl-tripeptide--D-alanyl-D-alanine ligase